MQRMTVRKPKTSRLTRRSDMPFLLLFWEYFKIGLFTIGGGYAMLPMVKQVVLQHGWLDKNQLISFIGISESTPGPFAINLATFVGMEVGRSQAEGAMGILLGFVGAAISTFAVVLPSLIIIIIVMRLFDKFNNNCYVQGALVGIRPVVVGLILSAVFTIGLAVFLPNLKFDNLSEESFSNFNWVSLLMFVGMFVLSRIKIEGKKMHPILLIVLSAVAGIIIFGVCGVTEGTV